MVLRIFFVLGLFALATHAVAQKKYLTVLADVPLAPGLREVAEGQLVFDKPQGRIVRVAAMQESKQAGNKAVAQFYRRTLPNLGWRSAAEKNLTFIREGEILKISFFDDLVVFDVAPMSDRKDKR